MLVSPSPSGGLGSVVGATAPKPRAADPQRHGRPQERRPLRSCGQAQGGRQGGAASLAGRGERPCEVGLRFLSTCPGQRRAHRLWAAAGRGAAGRLRAPLSADPAGCAMGDRERNKKRLLELLQAAGTGNAQCADCGAAGKGWREQAGPGECGRTLTWTRTPSHATPVLPPDRVLAQTPMVPGVTPGHLSTPSLLHTYLKLLLGAGTILSFFLHRAHPSQTPSPGRFGPGPESFLVTGSQSHIFGSWSTLLPSLPHPPRHANYQDTGPRSLHSGRSHFPFLLSRHPTPQEVAHPKPALPSPLQGKAGQTSSPAAPRRRQVPSAAVTSPRTSAFLPAPHPWGSLPRSASRLSWAPP